MKSAQAKIPQYRASLLKSAVEGELTKEWRAAHPAGETGADLLKRILAERRARWEQAQLAKMRERGETPWNDEWEKAYKEPKGPDVKNLPDLPEGWCWATVEQVGTYLRNGLPQKPQVSPPGYRILRINAVRPMQVNLNEFRYLPLSENEAQDYIIENGDILFTRYNGSLDLLGVAGMVRGCFEPTLHPDKLIRLKTVLKEPLSSFLEISCNTGVSRAFVESRARTTAGQKGISGSDIKQIPLPLPPLAEQAQIVAEVEARLSEIAKMEEVIEHSLRRAELERQSILREAFAGRLVAQNPEDEPARVLLERIREERRKREALEKERRKGERSMRKQEFTYKSTEAKLYQKLAEARAPMEPGELFRRAGFKIDTEMDEPEPAEQFFTGADHLATAGAIKEERPDDRTVLLSAVELPEEELQALFENAEKRVEDQDPQPGQAELWHQ